MNEDALFERLIERVRRGYDTFDCADIYTGVEELLGRFRLRVHNDLGKGARIQIHTKLVPDLRDLQEIDRESVEGIVDRSLIRLGVERLDLVQFHWWSYDVPRHVEVAGWLAELIDAGKVRHLGLTNFDTAHTAELIEAGLPVISTQVQYSMLDRRPSRELAKLCNRHGISILGYGALAGGFLSERWLGRSAPDSPASLDNRSLVKYLLILEEVGGWPAFQTLLRALDTVARRRSQRRRRKVSLSMVALRWTIEREAAAIVGVGDARHDLDGVIGWRLDEQDQQELEQALPRNVSGDVYDLERDRQGPHGRIMKYDLNRGSSMKSRTTMPAS